MKVSIGAALIAAALLSGCGKSGIPIIGLDKDGKEVTYYVPEKDYVENMGTIMMTAQESVYPALSENSRASSWHIRTLVLGLGFNLEFSAGPIITAGVQPRLRFAFSNSKKPILP